MLSFGRPNNIFSRLRYSRRSENTRPGGADSENTVEAQTINIPRNPVGYFGSDYHRADHNGAESHNASHHNTGPLSTSNRKNAHRRWRSRDSAQVVATWGDTEWPKNEGHFHHQENHTRYESHSGFADILYSETPHHRTVPSPSSLKKGSQKFSKFTQEGASAFKVGNFTLAKSKYEAAAAQGDISALHNLGTMYLHGQGVPKDYIRARDCFQTSAAHGLEQSMSQLGYIFFYGRGVPKDIGKARAWFLKAGGRGSDAYAQFHLGMIYILGVGVTKNSKQGREWLKRSARADFIPAIYNLAVIYLQGLDGAPQNTLLAASLLKRGAALGDANSQNNLGTLYAAGNHRKQSYTKAAALFQQAAHQGVPEAMYNLGSLYDNGLGVRASVTRAAKYYLKAASSGTNAEAEFNLGTLFLTGRGPVKQDQELSLYWFERSASHGHKGARNNVNVLRSERFWIGRK